LAKAGTILFPKSGAAILTNSRAVLGVDAYIVSHLAAVEPLPDRLDIYWTYFWLCTVDMKQLIDNPSYPSLRLSEISKLLIPLPPLEEQRRIVARIEELMDRVREARRLRQEAQKDAERLWQSVLAQTFPRPGSDLPEDWRWVRLGEVAWRDSVTLQPNSQPDTVFHYLGMEHVAPGQWDEPTPVELPGAEIKSQVIVYRPGLVLYGKLRPYLNKVVVPSAEGVASTEFIPLAVKEDVLEPQYLGAYLRSPSFVAYATQNTTGSRQPRVRLDALWGAPIPLPPLAEQRRIVAHLQAVQEKIQALKEAQAATEAELKRLEQAILEKAFRGEL
jgi:type I restriction enzyme S subunit